ncbi:methyltransferase domain-containing protein [uncultured Jannaschia sp.]|uniref:methyltransferase domain-containing protein n=1 Tax=uncultured Jannaschia sp. TaxID=293347 RepID=UPI002612C26E|nr:methyltransferase domain-containing protein [uncultured Jannaschia sp.]
MPRAPLTDTAALMARRARADGTAWFLHDAAMDEIEERLADVNRTFTAPAIVTGQPALWSDFRPGARIVPDAEVLDLAPAAHDLVIHAMALHWADDPVGQLIQCRRALRPDGLLMVATLGGDTLHELRAALGEAETRVVGGLSPRVAPMGEVRDMGALLQRAGLALPVADLTTLPVRYRDLPHLARDLRAMGETNALAARHRVPPPRALFSEAARLYREAFPDGDGIRATFQTIFLTGWAPSEDQPKPLRPGSAQARLADALGTTEYRGDDL